jgi:heptosyltransferase-2
MAPPISAHVRHLAIVCPSWVGDTVMATPVFRAARAAVPAARIVAVVRPGLQDILGGSPRLDEIVACDMKGVIGPARTARAIRSRNAQAVLLLPNSFRSALAARLSGAPIRIGYRRDGRGWLLSHSLDPPATNIPIPATEYYMALARYAFGLCTIDPYLELRVTEDERSAANALLGDVKGPYAVINPGANRADKRWPAERFANVADHLARRHQLTILLTGSPGERATLESVVRAARSPMINLSQRGVRLGSLKAVIERAAIVITNDTGPRHFAAAMGTPVVTLFGPTDHRWTSLNLPHERMLLADPFLPEERIADRHKSQCAMSKISVGDVVYAAESLLAQREAGRGCGAGASVTSD